MADQWIDLDRAASTPTVATSPDVVQAGFLRRWAALFLDQLILSAGFYGIFFIVILATGMAREFVAVETGAQEEISAALVGLYLGMVLLYYLGAGLYYALMESSSRQATVGKMALGIKVVDRNGARLSFAHALGRWFAASLSYLTLYIGFLMAAFTRNKQALHDLVAGTQVVDQWAYTDHPERQSRSLGGCLIVFVAAMVAIVLLALVAIVAAISIPAYQQYAGRAQAAQLEAPLGELRERVRDHYEDTGRCPDNDSPGFQSAHDYADGPVSRIVVGEFEPGFCGISVWMPPLRGTVERQFLLEFDPDDAIWYCTDKADLGTLPGWCA